MSVPLAPPPPNSDPLQDRWMYLLWKKLTQAAQIPWSVIDPTGSNLTDLTTRNHNDLQTIQGGTTAEYYHTTAAQNAEIARRKAVTSTAVSASMDDTAATWRVTADAQTLTLPAASTARIGNIWTVNFSTTGTLTIQAAGSDTIMTPTSATDTSVIITIQGTSLDFECASATTWIIV